MIRNGTGSYIHYSAYNASTNKGESGDVANHHLKLVIDGVETDPNNTPEAIAFDEYRIFVDPAESLGVKFIRVGGISDTSDVYIIPADAITDLLKPGVPFTGCYTTWDIVNNVPMLADAGNQSIRIAQDGTDSAASGQSEVNAVTLPGTYKVAATGAQANGRAVSIIGGSSNADASIISTELAPYNEDQAAEADVRLGTDYAEGTLTGTAAIPAKPDTRLGTAVDDGVGTLAVAPANDVRDGVPTDDTTGTAAIPGANDVRLDVPTDATLGNYVPADEDKHQLGDSYGSLGTEFTGTKALTSYQLPQEVILEDEEIIIFEGCD